MISCVKLSQLIKKDHIDAKQHIQLGKEAIY